MDKKNVLENVRVLYHSAVRLDGERVVYTCLLYTSMAAAEVEPFHLMQVGAELFFYSRKGGEQSISVLLTEGVEMQSFDAVKCLGLKIG